MISKPPTIRAELAFGDTCTAAGLTATGAAPVLVLCRRLLEAGHDPATRLQAWRGSILCLVVRSIGEAAGLTVEDRPSGGKPPRFIRYRPMPDRAEGSPAIALLENSDLAVMESAE